MCAYISGCFFFFQAEDGIRDLVRSRGLGDVYKRQGQRLIEAGAAIGREKGYEVLWLGVWDKNVAAQKLSLIHI